MYRNQSYGRQWQTGADQSRRDLIRRWIPQRIMVDELQHCVLIRDGRLDRVLEPGPHKLRPRHDRLVTLPAVPQNLSVRSQEILTADGVTVRATVSVMATLVDPIAALRAGDWNEQLHLALQLALRVEVTNRTLEDLVAMRSDIDQPLLAAATAAASPLGLEITTLAVRDLVVPGEQRTLLAQVVNAQLAGRAALERARAETAAVRSLANAASMMNDNPSLYQLRLLQEMANTKGNTFIIGTDQATALPHS